MLLATEAVGTGVLSAVLSAVSLQDSSGIVLHTLLAHRAIIAPDLPHIPGGIGLCLQAQEQQH